MNPGIMTKSIKLGDRVRIDDVHPRLSKPWATVVGIGLPLVKLEIDFDPVYGSMEDFVRYRHVKEVVG